MIDRVVEGLGLLITNRIGDNECTALDSTQMTEKTVMLLENTDFMRAVIQQLAKFPASYVCRVESVNEFDGKLVVVCAESGERDNGRSVYDAYAACCAAIVLRECGAVHGALGRSIRRSGECVRVFGLDKIVPYSPEGEAAEIREIEAMSTVKGDDLDSLRESLAVYINRWEMVQRKAPEAEKVKCILMSQPTFKDEWKSLEYINAGAYGFIYRAVSAQDGKEYALKVMCVGNDMEKLWKAKRESTNASQFYKSDYIVKTFDDGKITVDSEKYIWISMELLEPIPCEIKDEKTVARIACDVCRALEEIHRNGGMAHRDVKPANILRGSKHWKLCDFGITKEVQGREMATVIGTSDYMAPELLRAVAANSDKASYDNSVDIYALGVTMYTLLNRGSAPFTSAPPYISKAAEQKNARVRRIQGEPLPRPVNCSERLMRVIEKACRPNPSERYSSVSKMYDALEDFLDDLD